MLLSRYRPWRPVPPRSANRPLRCMFVITSMPVGGAETLLVNLMRRMDRQLICPEVICMKQPGPLGEQIADEFRVHSNLLSGKWDMRVLPRLVRLMNSRQADVVVTVGAGDKMFWGRLAAHVAGVPVIASALHSTGWPDGVGRLNRRLTGITDAFIAVADSHGEFLRDFEKFPGEKVHVIRNGIDCQRFIPDPDHRDEFRRELGVDRSTPLIGIVAALRPEKNHEMLLNAAAKLRSRSPDPHGSPEPHNFPEPHWVIVGDGPQREQIESLASELQIQDRLHLLGTRHDTPRILAALDLFALCSLNEASPVSILEALSCGVPVVATDVGSISESIIDGETGLLVPSEDGDAFTDAVATLLSDPNRCRAMGAAGRSLVEQTGSLQSMVDGYQRMMLDLYDARCQESVSTSPTSPICRVGRTEEMVRLSK